MNLLSGFVDISLIPLILVACVALFASVIGGVAGYGTGALMPLVLVPLIGAEPVVPIIAISAIFSNFSRATAYRRSIDGRRAGIVMLASAVTTALGAYGYAMLTSAGAAVVIGGMLILSSRCGASRGAANCGLAKQDWALAPPPMALWWAAHRARVSSCCRF